MGDLRPWLRDDARNVLLSDLWIRTKAKRLVRFVPNEVQSIYLDTIAPGWEAGAFELRGLREDCLKSRQMGMSTLILALIFLDTVNHPMTRSLIMAHDLESTEVLFEMVHRFEANLPTEKRRPLKHSNRRELYWSDIDSRIFVGTAGRDSIGRGATLNNVHMSERAKWAVTDIAELDAGLMEALPAHGNAFKETTAHGLNHYHKAYMAARRGETGWTPRFYGWAMHPEYRAPAVEFVPTDEERAIAAAHHLDNEQLAWRRAKVRDLAELFPQEYPLTAEEAFVTSVGFGVFDLDYLLERREELPAPVELRPGERGYGATVRIWEPPKPGETYALWVDPHGGRRGDNLDETAAHVINVATGNQCLTYRGQPDVQQCAADLGAISRQYGRAVIGVLRAGVGEALLLALIQQGAPLWSDQVTRKVDRMPVTQAEEGFPASREVHLIESLREAIRIYATGGVPRMVINDIDTIDQMIHYVHLPNGKRGGEEGWHDDLVPSWAGCVWYVANHTWTPSQREDAQARKAARLAKPRRTSLPRHAGRSL